MNGIDGNTTSGLMLAHSNTINRISFTPDGKYIVSASEDTTVKVWETESGKLRHTFYALEGGEPLSINISPDGIYVAIGYGPGDWHYKEGTRLCPRAVIIREIQSGKIVKTLKGHYYYGVNSVAFSPDGRQLLSASHYHDKDPVILWDWKKSRKIKTYETGASRRRFVSFLPDRKYFVVAGKHNDIDLVDIESGETIRYWKDDGEHFILPVFGALSPDGKKLLLGSNLDDEYMIWDIESGQEKWVNALGDILSFAVSPDGLTLACGRKNGIDLYQFGTEQIIKIFPLIQTNVTALAFSPDGKYLAFGSDNNASAYYSVSFKILDIETGIPRYSLFTPVDSTSFAVCDPDGEHLYIRASRNILKVWDTASGRELSRITGDWRDIRYAALSPDGGCLAGALTDSDIMKIWDTLTGREIRAISTGLPDSIESLIFRCGGSKIVVLTNDGGLHIFDAKAGKHIASLSKKYFRWQPNFNSPDDRYFAVIGDSGDRGEKKHITIFDMETTSAITTFPLPGDHGYPAALYYAPGVALAALHTRDYAQSEDKQYAIAIYNVVSGETIFSDATPYINEDSIVFSPSGEYFTVSYGRNLQIVPIKAQGGEEIIHIPVNHQSNITHITYLSNVLISASDDCIDIADSKTGKLLRTIAESTDLCLLPANADGRFLATASNSIIKTWNIKGKIQKIEFPVFGYPEEAVCLPEGRKLFSVVDSSGFDLVIQCHDTITGKRKYVLPVSEELSGNTGFSFRPGTDQMLLYDSFGPGVTKIYNFRTGADVLSIEQRMNLTCAAYSHDGKFIVCGSGSPYAHFSHRKRKLFILDADTGVEIKKFPRTCDTICTLALSHDDKYLVTGSACHKVALWDLEKPVAIRTYSGHKDMINMVAFTHDGRRIVSSSKDTTMRIWDRDSAVCLAVFHGIKEVIPESVSNPAWTFIAALTVHGTVKLFDKDTLKEAAYLINFKDGSWVFS
jgi:WD40 repeat protein